MPLLPEVGEVWLCDTTSIYGGFDPENHWSRREHWLILRSGTVAESPPPFNKSDHYVVYIHLETGLTHTKFFYQRGKSLDLRGSPYYKRVS